jgi:hypothetical protein
VIEQRLCKRELDESRGILDSVKYAARLSSNEAFGSLITFTRTARRPAKFATKRLRFFSRFTADVLAMINALLDGLGVPFRRKSSEN